VVRLLGRRVAGVRDERLKVAAHDGCALVRDGTTLDGQNADLDAVARSCSSGSS